MKTKHTLPERLQMVMTHLGLNNAELGRECGVKRQNVNNWLKGSEPAIEALARLQNRRGINPFWILWEDGEMLSPLFRIPEENRQLYDFVAGLTREEAAMCLEALYVRRTISRPFSILTNNV